MRLRILALLILCLANFVACNENVKEDENKPPEINVSDVLSKINDASSPFPADDIAKLDEGKEKELLNQLVNTVLSSEDVLRIAIIRKNQGKFEPALRWLCLNISDDENFVEIRYRKAQVLYALGKLKEAYILCKLQTLPDEISSEFRKLFNELRQKVEKELSAGK